MANFDLTQNNANSINSGVRRFVRKYGAMDEITIILDEDTLVADQGAIAAADTLDLMDLEAGDTVVGGYAEVLVAGATATATLDYELNGGVANGIVTALDADAAVGTQSASAAALRDFLAAVGTLRVTVNTAGMSTATSGRWAFVAYVLRGSVARKTYEQYVGDPNNPPQAS